MDDQTLLKCLSHHPVLRKRVESMLGIAENLEEIERADEAEERVIGEGRHLKREALEAWAQTQACKSEERFEKHHPQAAKDIKKTPLA